MIAELDLAERKIFVRHPSGALSFGYLIGRTTLLTSSRHALLPKQQSDGLLTSVVEMCAYNAWALKRAGFEFGPVLTQHFNLMFNQIEPERRQPPHFVRENLALMPYQLEGFRFLESRRGRAILADEMGLGKTLQAIAWLAAYPEYRPAVVACPAHLKWNWLSEFRKFYGYQFKIEVLTGRSPYVTQGEILIINYDILSGWARYLIGNKVDTLICDEAHFVKNEKAARTEACLALATAAKRVVLLSGTPLENNVLEIWSLAKLVDPLVLGSHWSFKQEYMRMTKKPVMKDGKEVRGADGKIKTKSVLEGTKMLDHLHRVLSGTIMIRRKKVDVLPELPPKVHHVINLVLENDAYRRAEYELCAKIRADTGRALLGEELRAYYNRFGSLRQIASAAKLPQVIDWINSFLTETDRKLIVILHHKIVMCGLIKEFPDALVIDGSVSDAQEKMRRANQFQTDPSRRLIFGEISAIGTGYTLTSASDVLIVELPEKPSTLDQAIDRAHRIGQMSDQVDIWYPVVSDSIESDIITFLDRKRVIARAAIDGEDVKDEDLIGFMMEQIIKRTTAMSNRIQPGGAT